LTAKKITILLIPDGSRRPRQFKIPRAVLWFSFILILGFVGGLYALITDYWNVKKQMPRLAELEKKTKEQDVQLTALALKVDGMSSKMVKLKQFENQLRVMVNLEPNEDNAQLLGVGGSDPVLVDPALFREQDQRKLVRRMYRSLDNLDVDMSAQAEKLSDLCAFLKNQKTLLACTPSIWPTRGWISSRFGFRISPFTNQREFHRGLDICTREGAKIVAPADGVVVKMGRDYGYGIVLTINHKFGIETKYAHLKKILVKRGQTVKRGDVIALVGNTGRSTGPHLHYEVHLNGAAVDPLRYILN